MLNSCCSINVLKAISNFQLIKYAVKSLHSCDSANESWANATLLSQVSGFIPWGTGGPPIGKNFANPPPSDTCPRFWTKACPLQPRFVPV